MKKETNGSLPELEDTTISTLDQKLTQTISFLLLTMEPTNTEMISMLELMLIKKKETNGSLKDSTLTLTTKTLSCSHLPPQATTCSFPTTTTETWETTSMSELMMLPMNQEIMLFSTMLKDTNSQLPPPLTHTTFYSAPMMELENMEMISMLELTNIMKLEMFGLLNMLEETTSLLDPKLTQITTFSLLMMEPINITTISMLEPMLMWKKETNGSSTTSSFLEG
jgi:hypothetical protein